MTSIGNHPQTEGRLPDMPEDGLSYGTHTLPKEFWLTVKRGENLLAHPDFRRRRAAKNERHSQRRIEKAEENRRRGTHK